MNRYFSLAWNHLTLWLKTSRPLTEQKPLVSWIFYVQRYLTSIHRIRIPHLSRSLSFSLPDAHLYSGKPKYKARANCEVEHLIKYYFLNLASPNTRVCEREKRRKYSRTYSSHTIIILSYPVPLGTGVLSSSRRLSTLGLVGKVLTNAEPFALLSKLPELFCRRSGLLAPYLQK